MLKILVIDDDHDLLTLLKTYLETDPNTSVETANDFSSGINALEKCFHDVYLIDYELDGSHTGIDLIRKGYKLGLTPLIMLTSTNDDRLAESAIAAGACDFITKKNLNLGHLRRVIQNNITRSKRVETLLKERNSLLLKSHYDSLTGLANRYYITKTLQQPCSNNINNHSSILFLDLDGFKNINDKYGHSIGDEILKQVATRLVKSVQETDIVARLGGDEFLIYLQPNDSHTDTHLITSVIATRIIHSINQPFIINFEDSNDQKIINLTISIGIAIYPEHSKDYEQLIKLADQSMYLAKSLGKNQFLFHEPQHSTKYTDKPVIKSNSVNS
jgi:diguanylate cyclase (GGDEF)-like protein